MTINVSTPIIGTVLSAALAGLGWLIISRYWQGKKKLPENWSRVGTLAEIIAYPIKSCGGIELMTAECTNMGIRDDWLRDRVLMVVNDKDSNFIHARAYPQLLFVKPTLNGSVLTLTYKDSEPISINLAEVRKDKPRIKASVWSMPVPVYDCGDKASEWFTRLLQPTDNTFRLVYYASENCRQLRETKNKEIFKFTKYDSGALPDEASFNLVNQSSVEDLNKRLAETKVSHRNFRPNFLVTGAQAYDEDGWKYVKIGDVIFEVIMPCTRCVFTTINPETGIRDPKTEPLETLKSYRQFEDPAIRSALGPSPRFGLQMALRSAPGGLINIDDPVYVA